MIQPNAAAMTNAEIVSEYHSLVAQVEQYKKAGGRVIIGVAFTDKIAFLKQAMEERGLT